MALTEYDITKEEALRAAGLRKLPDRAVTPTYNKVWIKGIALVTKLGGIKSFCLCENNGLGVCEIKRDFGSCNAIISIDTIYPYQEVEARFKPDLRSNKAIIAFLGKNGHNEVSIESLLNKEGKTPEQIKEDKAIVEKYINQVAVKLAKKTLAEEERCKALRNYKPKDKDNERG